MMFLPTDKALSFDVSRRFLPFMMAFIVFMSSIILAISGISSEMLRGFESRLSESAAVQVLPDVNAKNPRAELDKTMEAIRKVLTTAPGIKSFKIPSEKEEAELLRPWLGEITSASVGIPLPKMVILETKKGVDYDALSLSLKNISPLVNIERSGDFSSDLKGRIVALKVVLDIMMIMIAAAAGFAIIHSVRASIAANRSAIDILHFIGATNYYIASRLSNRILILAAAGAGIGIALSAAALYYLKVSFSSSYHTLALPGISLAWILIVPVSAALLAKAISFLATFVYLKEKS